MAEVRRTETHGIGGNTNPNNGFVWIVIVDQHDLIIEGSAERPFIPELTGLVPRLL